MFDRVGEYDENSVFYLLRDPNLVALDQNIKQSQRIANVQTSLQTKARDEAAAREARIVELEQRCLALGLYAQALGQILVSKGLATSDEIREAIVDIDLLDGKLDGR